MKSEEENTATELERSFTGAIRGLHSQTIHATRGEYAPTGLLELVDDYGGIEAARNLIHRSSPSPGYQKLYHRRLLNLTVEALVLQPQWARLFDREDLIAARSRLSKYEFEFPQDYWRPNA